MFFSVYCLARVPPNTSNKRRHSVFKYSRKLGNVLLEIMYLSTVFDMSIYFVKTTVNNISSSWHVNAQQPRKLTKKKTTKKKKSNSGGFEQILYISLFI